MIGLPVEVAQRLLEAQGLQVVRVRVLRDYGECETPRGQLIVVSQRPAGEKGIELWCCARPLGPKEIASE